MTKDKEPLVVTLKYIWSTVTPDPRQYNQQREELSPIDSVIEIDIPLDKKYIRNKADILVAQTSSDMNIPAPILTPDGMFLAISLLEAPFHQEIEDREDGALNDSKVDWGEDEGMTIALDAAESDWDKETSDGQFEPDETIIPDDDVGLDNANVDWEDEKSWD